MVLGNILEIIKSRKKLKFIIQVLAKFKLGSILDQILYKISSISF